MKRLLVPAFLVVALLVGPAVGPSGASAAPAEGGCAVTWGSAAKTAGPATSPFSEVVNARTGRHACFDRFVVDLGGPASGYNVRYVRRMRHLATGEVIRVPGGARIDVTVWAPAHDTGGNPTYPGVTGQRLPGVDVSGYQTFRSTRYGGTFEGQTQFGLGVRARLPFRVMKIGNRVVVDVAHHW